MPERSAIESDLPPELQRVRDDAIAAVLHRRDLFDRKIHNESLMREVADEVARAVRSALR